MVHARLRDVVLTSLTLGLLTATAFAQTQAPPPGYPPAPPPPGYPPPGYPPPGYPPPGYPPQPYGAPPAYPYGAPPPMVVGTVPGYHTHDGFYLRLQLGPGYAAMTSDQGSNDVKVSGAGARFSIAAGGAISPNLIIFGEIVGDSAVNPKVEVNGTEVAQFEDANANVIGIGGGIAYYIMPANLYLSAALLASKLTMTDKDGDSISETDYGFGADLSIGKEWWVTDNWGLGIAGQVLFATIKTKEEDLSGEKATWNAFGFSVAFSATFN